MSPDDKRHGTRAGYMAWCRCAPCTAANTREHKKYLLGYSPRMIDNRGTVRRIQALLAIGWTYQEISDACGRGTRAWACALATATGKIREDTAADVSAAYERMSMAQLDGPYRKRNRSRAIRQGWAPPLAYDDIDRDEAPTGVYTKPTNQSEWMVEHTAKRTADLEHSVDLGRTLEQAADALSLSTEAVEVWCKRRNRLDLLAALHKRSREREMGSVA